MAVPTLTGHKLPVLEFDPQIAFAEIAGLRPSLPCPPASCCTNRNTPQIVVRFCCSLDLRSFLNVAANFFPLV
jgi:hypothetical protein